MGARLFDAEGLEDGAGVGFLFVVVELVTQVGDFVGERHEDFFLWNGEMLFSGPATFVRGHDPVRAQRNDTRFHRAGSPDAHFAIDRWSIGANLARQ